MRPNFYAAVALDRAGRWRKDPAWVRDRLTAPETRFVPVWRSHNLIAMEGPRAVLLQREEIGFATGEAVFLGLRAETAIFAIDLSSEEAPTAPVGDAEFVDLRRVGPLLAHEDGALLAYARGILHWHQRHRFCGACGAPTEPRDAGHVRACTAPGCASLHFPRTDPAVIMLVTDGPRVLLGRQKAWPPGMYSTLAGFVEPGESLEQAVAREVKEETGIDVADVAYHSSQPWPFPASIMLGFTARAVGGTLAVDPDELEDAAWFDRDRLARHTDDSDAFRLPRRDSIARRLIEDWLRTDEPVR